MNAVIVPIVSGVSGELDAVKLYKRTYVGMYVGKAFDLAHAQMVSA